MKRIGSAFFVLTLSLGAAACKGDESGPSAKGGAQKGPDFSIKYAKIDRAVAAAKTGDDFLKISTDCGGLEIEAAMAGNDKLKSDAEYIEHCRVGPARARAKRAIAESAGGKMSSHCLAASMRIEELVEEGIQAEELKKLLAEVNTACGM